MRRLQDSIHNDTDKAKNAAEEHAGRGDYFVGQLSPPQPHQNGDGGRRIEDVGQQEQADDVVILKIATSISSK